MAKKIGIFITIFIINTFLLAALLGHVNRKNTVSSEQSLEVIEINTVEAYLQFAQSVKEGRDYKNCQILLSKDLDFSVYENIPMIGDEAHPFAGVFDGNACTLYGMKISSPEGYCGMFGNLTGIVKNLRMEEGSFSGKICGAIAANTYDGAVLNCYVDAVVQGEVSGTLVGKLHGNLLNCVIASGEPAGEFKKGLVENCYLENEADFQALNDNLAFVSGYYRDTRLFLWDSEEKNMLTGKKAELLENLTARMKLHGKELKIFGYYSCNDRSWSFVLPAGWEGMALTIEADSSAGDFKSFSQMAKEECLEFQWKGFSYPIQFLHGENLDTFFVTLKNQKDLNYVHAHKQEEIPGVLMIVDQNGAISYENIKGFYGHGNDSWAVEKKSYNLKMDEPTDLLHMGADEDFSLLACYRDNSLMCYATTTELCKELGFDYSPQFRFVNLYVQGEYAGVYFLAEKVELGEERIDIESSYEALKLVNHGTAQGLPITQWKDADSRAERYYYSVEKEPEDLSGGYLLEADIVDYEPEESRFVSSRGIPMTMKRARYSSEAQVHYIADFWQDFEDALFSENGVNQKGKHYTEYIDLESFAMQWLIYELVQEGSMSSSIYFYKESELSGDGLLHACFPWDMEHSYVVSEKMGDIWNLTEKAETLYGYWTQFTKHEDFMEEAKRLWEERFVPAIDLMIAEESVETASGMRNLCWYEERIKELSHLENSRWRKMDPLTRCETNREFLRLRKEVLSRWLAQ